MIGNITGTGKNDGGSSPSNKLYCVTIDKIYRFYSYVQINDVNDLKSYLNTKGTIPATGVKGSTGTTYYIIDEARTIEYNTETSFIVKSVRIKGTFSNKQYQGGEVLTNLSGTVTYNSITSIECLEV